MKPHYTLFIVFAFIFAKTLFDLFLERLNRSYSVGLQGIIPEAFKDWVDQETFGKSINYTLSKSNLSSIRQIWDAVVLVAVLSFGALPYLYYGFFSHIGSTLWPTSLSSILILMILAIPDIPFSWWSQFRLEDRFGFNTTSYKTWIMDRIKVVLLSLLVGTPLVALMLQFFYMFPDSWWLLSFVAVSGFQFFIMLIYPYLILPIFNKLAPLEEGSLKERLLTLAQKASFPASTIQVMDGSKRSKHSNAFFTGFGRLRKIVLYDTLIEQLNEEELEAVLAHEIGHYKKGHIYKRLVLSTGIGFLTFYALGWLVKQDWLYYDFGFSKDSGIAPALLLFVILSGYITCWLQPLFNALSRKHEYEADAYAKATIGKADPLIGALRKLHEKNLSNLTPHPLYSFFHYSHPTLLERELALCKK